MKKQTTAASRRWGRQETRNNDYLADAVRPLPPAPAENEGAIKFTARAKTGAFAKSRAKGGPKENEGFIDSKNPLAAGSSTEDIDDGSRNQ
ncbi:MAG TPA: hypothetical protein VKV74_15310 [Bryobacteraceae bacterium]|nr:hypothetical protein [Bryobacteraceae bacterium]